MATKKLAILLHNIRSAHNVGAILRSADASGAEKVWLSGYTPTPVDRFMRARSDVAKAALGAEESVPWEHKESAANVILNLQKDGWLVVAVEQSKSSKDYRSFNMNSKTCFVFGNEVRGLSSALIKKCDEAIEIPMHGKKESLNVSVAAGIILFSVQSSEV